MTDEIEVLKARIAELESLEPFWSAAAETQVRENEKLYAALLLTETADLAHSECEECGGEQDATICGECFPMSDRARVARRLALGIPDILAAPMEGQTTDEIAAQVSGGRFKTMRAILDWSRKVAAPSRIQNAVKD